jgi:hypothetical protein
MKNMDTRIDTRVETVEEFLRRGGEITKIKDSRGQRSKVRFEHGFRRGRIGWFECK